MGTGNSSLYNGTTGSFRESSIQHNVDAMSGKYKISTGGYFGEKGKNVRVIRSPDPVTTSIDFYQKIGKGGQIENLPNGKGTKTLLGDGTVIVHRIITSTKGSPAVEISVSGSPKIKNQKIHFILEE